MAGEEWGSREPPLDRLLITTHFMYLFDLCAEHGGLVGRALDWGLKGC